MRFLNGYNCETLMSVTTVNMEYSLEKGIESYESLGLPYLDYLKLHLEEAYPDVMDLYNKIKMNHADWSHKN